MPSPNIFRQTSTWPPSTIRAAASLPGPGEHPHVPESPRRTGITARRVAPHTPSIAVDGAGASGIHRLPVPPDASRTADPLLSNLTGTWLAAGEATNPATHVQATVSFPTSSTRCRSGPGVRRGRSRRHPDVLHMHVTEVVGRSPRRSVHAPPCPEPKRSRRLPAGAGATVVGGHRCRGHPCAAITGRNSSRFPATPLNANGIG